MYISICETSLPGYPAMSTDLSVKVSLLSQITSSSSRIFQISLPRVSTTQAQDFKSYCCHLPLSCTLHPVCPLPGSVNFFFIKACLFAPSILFLLSPPSRLHVFSFPEKAPVSHRLRALFPEHLTLEINHSRDVSRTIHDSPWTIQAKL